MHTSAFFFVVGHQFVKVHTRINALEKQKIVSDHRILELEKRLDAEIGRVVEEKEP